MIGKSKINMDDDEKGKRFLKLIDDQNNVQWNVIAKLTSLINLNWNSEELRDDLQNLVNTHSEITKELNSLDGGNSML